MAEWMHDEPRSLSIAFCPLARRHAGGVNSPVRAYGSVGGTPPFAASAKGPYLTDVDGNEYVDLVSGWGPMLLGHAHPAVVAAVQDATARGLSFGAPTPAETQLAELVVERIAPIEQVRLVSTGTEATMTALRLARGYTGRDLIVKFAGCYHGHSDGLLAAAGSGLATLALPGSAGVPEAITSQTIVVPFNDLEAVRAAFAEHPGQIAAVITEASPANMGVVPPEPGFNRALAELCAAEGALLVCDEVLTGFRTGPAGWWGEEQKIEASAGWQADLYTFGKVIGGGMPVAALGGSREIMSYLAPQGPVYQAGTLSGNPVAVAAGIATLSLADAAVYARVDAAAERIRTATSEALTAAESPTRCRTSATSSASPSATARRSAGPAREAGHATRTRSSARRPGATRRSSRPCSTRASTFRRACSRPGSYRPPTMTPPSTVSSRRCRRPLVLPRALRHPSKVTWTP